jgi:four helix bundle protein
MNYEDWEKLVPKEIRNDSLWKMEAYRLSMFIAELAWFDSRKLVEQHLFNTSDQLFRSVGSISANLAEGYSRSTGKDRAHFYEYSLGSARESRDWYFKSRHVLGGQIIDHRIKILTSVIRLLLTSVPHQRGYILRESSEEYLINEDCLDHAPLP